MNADTTTTTTETTREQRKAIRQAARCDQHDHCPIVVVEGSAAPREVGQSYRWTTPSGREVRHPSAYRAHYGRPVYHHSTRRIEVGAEWLAMCAMQAAA